MQRRALAMAMAGLVGLAGALLPLAAGAPINNNANVANKAPTLYSDAIPSSASPTSGTTTSMWVEVTFEDGNGHNDLDGATVTVYQSDNSTVEVPSGSATKTGGSGKRGTYNYSFDMDYDDAAGTYYVRATASDRASASATAYLSFTYGSLAALSLSVSSVTLNPAGDENAELQPGEDSRSDPASVTISNAGNAPLDLQFSGTDLTGPGGATIPVASILYSRSSDMSSETAFGATAQTDTGFNLATDGSKSAYFAVTIPEGVPAGSYAGTITLAAVAG
ncbi:MAG TPA: hypothetical protein VGR28_00840 [Candidatus Thermoplasmatota archaeon]|jgi:hypothetical protein|nr:hypothetical protein [Candidatus Thermoplasmatota archaeon]